MDQNLPQKGVSTLADAQKAPLPPVENCFGTIPLLRERAAADVERVCLYRSHRRNFHHQNGHVVVLRRASGKNVGGDEDRLDNVFGGSVTNLLSS